MIHLKSLTIAASFVFCGGAFADTLTLQIKNTSAEGMMRAAVFSSQAAFDADQTVAVAMGRATAGTSILTIQNLQAGTYGVAVFQDVNGNEKLDTNLFGAPNEPFGFSNDPRIGFSAPKFDAFQFQFDGTATDITITLNGG